MEAKKNPSKDIHRMSGMFFQIGLGISIAIVIMAFEWRTEIKPVALRFEEDPNLDLIPNIPSTDLREPPPPSPIKSEPPLTNPVVPTTISLASYIDDDEPTDDIPTLDPTLSSQPFYSTPEDAPETCDECFTLFPEKQAEPLGGYESFYKILRDNLKYPPKAQRNNMEGKVFVEFIVNRDGTPADIKVIRGVGFGFDEEAMRVIGLTKWNPGKQRGKPVRVKMVLPIVFKLN